MAHHLQSASSGTGGAAIFSPSVARMAASAAKDWHFVDAWLAARWFRGRAPPPFERNPDTLRALLALAALGEAADDERALLAQVEATALEELRDSSSRKSQGAAPATAAAGSGGAGLGSAEEDEQLSFHDARRDILVAVEESLSREGKAALDALAGAAVQLGTTTAAAASSTTSASSSSSSSSAAPLLPETVAAGMVDLQSQLFDLQQTHARIAVLQTSIASEARRLAALAADLDTAPYRAAPDLARANLDAQRRVRAAAARLPELRDQLQLLAPAADPADALPPSLPSGGDAPTTASSATITVEQVRAAEADYAAAEARRRGLDARVRAFAGLPADAETARVELEALRAELRRVTRRRDAVFEGLVERETPRKQPPGAR